MILEGLKEKDTTRICVCFLGFGSSEIIRESQETKVDVV